MTRPRMILAVAVALFVVVVAVVIVAIATIGGGEDQPSTGRSAPTAEPAGQSAPPAGAPGMLPPEFVQCMADRGFPIQSPAEMHSAPPEVLQGCFGRVHGDG